MHIKAARGMGLLVVAGLAAAANSSFGQLTYTFSQSIADGGRGASVTFNDQGGDLVVTLSNMGTEPTTKNWDATYLLGAVFFNYTGPGTLTYNESSMGGILPSGNGTVGSLANNTTIGSYWAYGSGLAGPDGAQQVLTGTGYNLNGLSSTGNMGLNGQLVDGANGSLLGWNNDNNANSSVTGHLPLAYTTIQFTLIGSGLPSSLVASDFTDVTFQYGTMLSESGTTFEGTLSQVPGPAVPEPNWGMAAGMMMMSVAGWRSFKKLRVA